MALMLTIAQDTWLTLNKPQDTDLPDDHKHRALAGETFPLLSHEVDADFFVVTLDGDRLGQPSPFGENLTWYVNAADVKIVKGSPVQFASFLSGFRGIVAKFLPKKPDTDTP
ncbi:hypothetical protein ACKFKF_20400 [Phormidesmis sp. 146-12]